MAKVTKANEATEVTLSRIYAVTRVVGNYQPSDDWWYDHYLLAPVSYTRTPYIIVHTDKFGHYVAIHPKSITMETIIKSGHFNQANAERNGAYVKIDAVLDIDGKLRIGKEITEDTDKLPVAESMEYTDRIAALKEFFAKCPVSDTCQAWQAWPESLKLLKTSVESIQQ